MYRILIIFPHTGKTVVSGSHGKFVFSYIFYLYLVFTEISTPTHTRTQSVINFHVCMKCKCMYTPVPWYLRKIRFVFTVFSRHRILPQWCEWRTPSKAVILICSLMLCLQFLFPWTWCRYSEGDHVEPYTMTSTHDTPPGSQSELML